MKRSSSNSSSSQKKTSKKTIQQKKGKKSPAKKRLFSLKTFFKLSIALFLLWLLVAIFYYLWALTFDLSKIGKMSQRSLIYDRYGRVYSTTGTENRRIVPFDQVSNNFVNALISREDTRFYEHHGIDPVGIGRAVVENLLLHGMRQGGSTITQQLARNSFPLGGRTLNRKLLEAAMAFRIETELSKEKILELYMNRIYFGVGFYGVEAASLAYFGCHAYQMSLAQAALLAGLIRSPNHLSPLNNPEGALQQRNVVLKRMCELGFITPQEEATACREPVSSSNYHIVKFENGWAIEAILKELAEILPPETLDHEVLYIKSTIDPSLQATAEQAVTEQLTEIEKKSPYCSQRQREAHKAALQLLAQQEKEETTNTQATAFPKTPPKETLQATERELLANQPPLQAALLALDNQTGGITAIVGGRDYQSSTFNRAFIGERQVGSAVKPFIYTEAFATGMKPNTPISDGPLTAPELPRGFKNYRPHNSDHTYLGILPAEEGLIRSRNTMTIRIGLLTGLSRIAQKLQDLGLQKKIPAYPATCLGTFDSSLLRLTRAYTALATSGSELHPHIIEEIRNAQGKILFKATSTKLPLLNPTAARMTTTVLTKVIERGTGASAKALGLTLPAAGKTGTTNNSFDAWFLGFTQGITCGVWVGFDKPKPIMPGGYGATLALPIWTELMTSPAIKHYPTGNLPN